MLTPERAIEVQCLLGADIQMVLDECTPFPATHDEAEILDGTVDALGRALEGGIRSDGRSRARRCSASCRAASIPTLREQSAGVLHDIGFDGYAIGGLAVGEGQAAMLDTVAVATAVLPEDRPRYLMGVGTPEDLLEAIARGIDMFDCVMPTRSGRHCQAFTWGGRLNLRNAKYAEDPSPLDAESACPAARYSRAYLHHLVKCGEVLGAMLLSWANVHFYQELMAGAREAIARGAFAALRRGLSARRYATTNDAGRDLDEPRLAASLRGDVGGGTGGLRAEHLALAREEIEAERITIAAPLSVHHVGT